MNEIIRDVRHKGYKMCDKEFNVILYAGGAVVNAESENNLQRYQIMLSKVSYENNSK
jgi:hypothetical protein